MFNRILTLSLAVVGLAFADPALPARDFAWPTSPVTVRLNSVPVWCSWRDGRPVAPRASVARLLRLPAEGEVDVDLIDALTQQNWYVQLDRDGGVVARPALQAQTPDSAQMLVRETDESRRAVETFAHLCVAEHHDWVKNDPRQQTVDTIGQSIARQARRPVPWTFAIVRDREPNAACTGEGMVFVTTGLLDLGLDHDELAGVLGHEVAHGARQQLAEDRVERTRRTKTSQDITRAENEYTRAREAARARYEQDVRDGANAGMAESAYRQSVESADSRLRYRGMVLKDRVKQHVNYAEHKAPTDERQADLAGVKYAMAAGYSPDGLLRALQKLQFKKYHRYGTVKMLGSRTHPPIADRIRSLEQLMEKAEFRKPGPAR
jgi:hypothetical protein